MSGTVRAGTPWTRTALADFALNRPDALADIEARMPDGMHVSLFCGSKPRPLGAILVLGREQLIRVEPGYQTVGGACYAVLSRIPETVA